MDSEKIDKTGDVLEFTKEAIGKHLDGCIKYWRKRQNRPGPPIRSQPQSELMAVCYIDAYQSMRITIFREALSDE